MRQWLDNQYQNMFLYVPFLLTAGAMVYFTIYNEPNVIYALLFGFFSVVAFFYKKIGLIFRAICLIIFGFCYACIFSNILNTPRLDFNKHNLQLMGTVKNIDYTSDKARIMLTVNANDIGATGGDANIRLTVKDINNMPNIGDIIEISGGLFKPNHAYAPETFDYARWTFFNNITATGYVNDIKVISHNNHFGLNRLRNDLHKKSDSFLVDSLVLGYKSAVPTDDNKIWTATGIGHVWSISGFHMTLVGGWLFLIMYFVFRSVPQITKRIPAKIPATICAWFGLLFYLFLSGLDIATLRSFLMTTLVFGAFVFGRNAISVRNVAVAFCLIFLTNPHCVMQAGFQLSFSAVFAMVWLYQDVKPKMPKNKLLKLIWACVLTSAVATVFTAPFVAAHFGAIPVYGLIGNLILLPVFSVAIMPLVFIGSFTALFGFRTPIIWAHDIYNWLMQLAIKISDLPYATFSTPHISNVALFFFLVAFIMLIFIKPIKIKINYILFLVFTAIALIVVYFTPKPVFLTTYDNELVAFVNNDNKLEFNKSRASNHKFAFETWKQLNGEAADTPNKRKKHIDGLFQQKNIVYIQKFIPLMQNIERLCNDDSVEFIVSCWKINTASCQHKIIRGAFVIYQDNKIKYMQSKRLWN